MSGPRMTFPGFLLTVDTLEGECFKGYKKGDTFRVKDFVSPPDGFCAGALHSLFPILYGWTFGANFPFADAEVPRWWLYGNPVMTHMANGLNLLFPPGERFFIRSVKPQACMTLPSRSNFCTRLFPLSATNNMSFAPIANPRG